VNNIVREGPVAKPFDVALKDGFYDMFKVVQIPMSPKQLERMEATSLKLAKVIEQKIAVTVGFAVGNAVREQLQDLVSKAKLKEDTDNV
jgi:hypothetical protein